MGDELELVPSADGMQVVYHGRKLYSSRPLAGAAERVRRLTILPGTIILWHSPLLWYGIEELMQQTPPDCWVISVEADPSLRRLARHHLPASPTRPLTLIGTDPEELVTILSRIESGSYRRVVELTTNAAAIAHRSSYRTVRDLLDRQIQVVWQNRLTTHAMARLWVRNSIANVSLLHNSRRPSLDGRPVVVAGAGPSLDAAVHMIAELRAAIQLVAVDTAVPSLAAHGVAPDLVVAVEAQLANAYDFLPVQRRTYTLVADLGSTPTAVALHDRRAWIVSMHSKMTLLDRLAALPGVFASFPPLGSVGVTAVRLAMQLSSAPLFLTGLDFAVLPGQTHARATPAALRELLLNTRVRPVSDPTLHISRIASPSATGGGCTTTLVLTSYARELARTIGSRTAYQIAPIGPPIGASPVGIGEAASLLEAHSGNREATARPEHQSGPDGTSGDNAASLARFAEREIDLLDRLISGRRDEPLVRSCDYLPAVAGIHGRGGEAINSDAVQILAAYFRERWRLTHRLLTLPRS